MLFPFTGGGVNWGGVAVDTSGVVYVNTSRAAHVVTLIPRADFDRVRAENHGKEVSPQRGTPFGMKRELLASPFGAPCNPSPWGTLAALDLRSKRILWQQTLGTTEDLSPLGIALQTGTPNFGGPAAWSSSAPRWTATCARSTPPAAQSCGAAGCPPRAWPHR